MRGVRNDQIGRPVVASSAYASFGPVMYMTPSTTTGVTSSRGAPGTGKIQAGARRFTLAVLIRSSEL